MTAFVQSLRRVIWRRPASAASPERASRPARTPVALAAVEAPPVEIAPNDPAVAYFASAPGAVDLDSLELDSPAIAELRAAGVKLVVPLVSQGELIGLLNLGPRLSDQAYSTDDRRLLDNLAAQAAPALRVGQLVREQEAEARDRERLEGELEVARLIQHNFLPRELPDLDGWSIAAFYRPARAVGGDFYDFIELDGGLLGIVVGDVTDKGVPAAMVMSATRSVLRASAQRLVSPGEVLERVNELLCPDIPPKMFVTCLYGVLDPASGRFCYANAGHNLPYVRSDGDVRELRAAGMPLGLMPGSAYDERETTLEAGEAILLYSDGVVEAHDPEREMFGSPRLIELVGHEPDGDALIELLLRELDAFTGPGWEQEDDITLVALRRTADVPAGAGANGRVLARFEVESALGNERAVVDGVLRAVEALALPARGVERLKTAVAEAAMNAIEHGNEARPELPVGVEVAATDVDLRVRITDRGGGSEPLAAPEVPDLDAKLAGLQRPRGWGLYLIEHMVDAVDVSTDGERRTVELVVHLKGGDDA